jgi:glycosyltransferase involved in cell wall biosynthesis
MKVAPRLTIAIPTYNRANLVGRAIDSALAQTYPDLEILVSNNGSTDGTKELLDGYSDPRLRILHRDHTISAIAHGNYLLEQARGEFWHTLSDDDFIEPEFARKVMDIYQRHPRLSMVYTGCFLHYADVVVPAMIGPELETGPRFLAAFVSGRLNVMWCACVTRTEDMRRIGPMPPETICGDMFYWTKLAAVGSIGCVREKLSHYVWYRDAGTSVSSRTPVVEWTLEQKMWARDILAICERELAGDPSVSLDALRRYEGEFVARSATMQFVWTSLEGADRLSLLKAVPPMFQILRRGKLMNWEAVIASIVVPRWLLRNRVLAKATCRAKAAERTTAPSSRGNRESRPSA